MMFFVDHNDFDYNNNDNADLLIEIIDCDNHYHIHISFD